MKEIQQLRADLRKKGGELHVVKNTLFRIAAGEDAAKLPADLHNGTTAFAFVFENEPDVAKALLDYARTSRKLVVKGGFFGGRALTTKEVETLSELPPRDVLIAQVIGAIAAPLTTLVGTIEALYADPIRVIGAVADKVGEGAQPAAGDSNSPEASASPDPAEPEAESAPEAEAAPEAPAEPETPAETESTENA
ncbi:50S ribosomal protein L10 [Fimbriimonas ginsengisoli Gsoil 348]|uniref:Large ribosomal subunit protein uL10 n=1 Tax=Fimbriimonas ginsengisoli Gsoil 348 TaxID=661478 RepID=A0A068NVL7_FIMGI|nr:50S ribosomal protein L10 [Fimbriimonas ginsengisoli Gsoil 348]